MRYDYLVVGAGFAGTVMARLIAEQNKSVLLVDRRNHIAGNMYDKLDENGILVHQYGPHILVMNEERCFDLLSRFTEWNRYNHFVEAEIDGIEVPLPINLMSIDRLFDAKKAIELKNKLINKYGFGANVPILTLRESEDSAVKEFAEYIYEKVFLHYTMKMWSLSPTEVDPAVTGRIPVRLSYDSRHFLHPYQVMPKHGYTALFNNMLDHSNIRVMLQTDAKDVMIIDSKAGRVNSASSEIAFDKVIYTGALDELFEYKMGELPYRSLQFKFETYSKDYIQNATVLNWPDDRPATRRTEMKRLTSQKMEGVTTTIVEYPGAYQREGTEFNEPYYPIITEQCRETYEQYLQQALSIKNLIVLGRLADYKYYNMEATIMRALSVFDQARSK